MLRTQQVQKVLRDFQESKKLTPHVHTQSIPGAVMDADGKGPVIQQFHIGRSIPRIKKHEEESLAKTIFHKAMVHEEIRDRQVPLATGAGAAAGGAGAGAASDVVTFDDEDVPHMRFNLNTEMGARFPYTQSEGHLSLYLGKDYVHITTDNLEEQRRIYLENINRFFGKEPGAFGKLDIDESFKQKMVDVLIQERQMGPEYTVFYHGCEGNIGYLYDIFTELRQLLRLHFAKDRVVLRALDQAFQGIENVNEFVSKLTTQERPDYSLGYADSAISANVSLFGNMDRDSSCTLFYFYNNFSVKPVDLVSFINFINATLPGLTLSKDRYQRLFKTVMVKNPEDDGRLLQIFVKNDHVDELVYAAQAGGGLFTLEKDRRSESVGSCLNLLKSQPSNAAALMEGGEYIDGGKKSPHSIQARLFLKPELTHDTDVMKTFMYHRLAEVTPDKIQRLKTELRRYLAEDLARWMQGKVPPAEGELHNGSTKAVDIFKEHYTQVFGQPPNYEEESLNNQLIRIRDTKNLALLFSLAEKHPLKILLTTRVMDAQTYHDLSKYTFQPILLHTHGMFDTVSTLDEPFKKQLVDATLPILQNYEGEDSIKAFQILKDLNFFTAENFWPILKEIKYPTIKNLSLFNEFIKLPYAATHVNELINWFLSIHDKFLSHYMEFLGFLEGKEDIKPEKSHQIVEQITSILRQQKSNVPLTFEFVKSILPSLSRIPILHPHLEPFMNTLKEKFINFPGRARNEEDRKTMLSLFNKIKENRVITEPILLPMAQRLLELEEILLTGLFIPAIQDVPGMKPILSEKLTQLFEGLESRITPLNPFEASLCMLSTNMEQSRGIVDFCKKMLLEGDYAGLKNLNYRLMANHMEVIGKLSPEDFRSSDFRKKLIYKIFNNNLGLYYKGSLYYSLKYLKDFDPNLWPLIETDIKEGKYMEEIVNFNNPTIELMSPEFIKPFYDILMEKSREKGNRGMVNWLEGLGITGAS